MAFREVTMIEVREVLRLWVAGVPKKRIAAQVRIDPKTVRRYVDQARVLGLGPEGGVEQVDDAFLARLLERLRPVVARERGDGWALCVEHREFLATRLAQRIRLTKVRKLLQRQGVLVPYSTLHRFAVAELGFGRSAATVPVADGEPGEELLVDTGWVFVLEPKDGGKRRRLKAFIFTPSVSRYRFVYPILRETTEAAIEACEAAWQFYGGIFGVILVDNTKAIVSKADPLGARMVLAFLEYAQARGFHVDTTRVRKPTDKARVERTVRHVRDDCFGGERLATLEEARERALEWCRLEDGMEPHSRTLRLPREHFETVEAPFLKPAPEEPYDVPLWAEPKVGHDHIAAVDKALYSLPTRFIGTKLKARADRFLVKFYDGHRLVKIHPRQPPGGRHFDPSDFPKEKSPYAMRNVHYLRDQARSHGEHIGRYADRLLDVPLPWTRMRTVRHLLGLVEKYTAARVEEACAIALDADMVNVQRLKRMLDLASLPPRPSQTPAKIIPFRRFRRAPEQYALPGLSTSPAAPTPKGDD